MLVSNFLRQNGHCISDEAGFVNNDSKHAKSFFFVHLYDFTEEQTHANCDTRDEVKLELTDGWYPIRATLDEHLQGFVKKEIILVRMKFFVHKQKQINHKFLD